MIAAWLVLALTGPPVLPQLPERGVKAPPPAEPSQPESTGKSGVESAVESPSGPLVEPPATDAPSAKPQPSSKPHGPELPPDAAPSAAITQGKAAAPDAVQPLPAATDADRAAWADDDRRAQAPLSRASEREPNGAGPQPESSSHGSPRAYGDRPVRAASEREYGNDVVVRTAAPEPTLSFRRPPGPPKRSATFVVSYRNFTLSDALGRRQSWHFASVEVTPCRRFFRCNLLTEGGIEGGEAARAGDRADLMLMQKLGLGVQYPHWVTPFVEAQAGAGVTRMEVFERNHLAFTWSVGIDVGAQWAVTRWLFMHAAVGWIHPVLLAEVGTIHFDRAAFKVGFGF